MILRSMMIMAGVAVVVVAANAAPGLRASQGLAGLGFHAAKISATSDTHQQYLARAQADMKRWEARMRQWNVDAAARGAEMSADASRDLDKAWATLRVDWKHLQASGDDAWAKAQISFDHASKKMKTTWQTINPAS